MSLSPQDLTESYCKLIVTGWEKTKNTILRARENEDYDEELLEALNGEAERWAARTEALRSGDLCVYRFYCDKRRR